MSERKKPVIMGFLQRTFFTIVYLCAHNSNSAKINTPRVLLPWFQDFNVNFTFEIIEGGCYTWSLSRDDIIDLEPLYEDTWGHCSRAARVSVAKSCVPPGSVIILAEEVNTGEILRGDVDIDTIKYLKVTSTTWKLYLEEAPEAFEVVAYDDQENTFSTLEGVSFTWNIENRGDVGDEPLVTLVRWRDTDYEPPQGVTELEAAGKRSYSVLLYGQAMGECRVSVCLPDSDICTDFTLNVVASVVLTPATASIAPGDSLRYKVVRARAGRLTVQDISETLYYLKVPDTSVALLEDTVSLVRGTKIGVTTVLLMSGVTEVASATLIVAEPHSIRVKLRPADLLIRGEPFVVHAVVLDKAGHALTAGDDMLIRLTADGEANVDLLSSTENGTLTDAVALNAGELTITAKLHSVGGKILSRKVEGQVSAVAVEPLEIVPPELFVAWTDSIQELTLQHRGGGDEPVIWAESEPSSTSGLSLAPTGMLTVRGTGEIVVRVQLKKYPHFMAFGRVLSSVPEMVQVASTGHARVGRPHQLHVALTATHPTTGELYNFDVCNCATFALSLLEGPEPQNVTAAHWIQPVDGACCVLECTWSTRGISTVRVSRGRAGDTHRVAVRAAPTLLWPMNAAALVGATLPVIAEGETLRSSSSEPRMADIATRDGVTPYRHPDSQLFTLKCRKKGDSRIELASLSEEEKESVEFETACAPHVSRIRLEPSETPGNCSGGPKVWLRPGQEVTVKVTLLDAIGRELLDERGPKMTWDVEPHHVGINYKATDRLFVETHPDFDPVPVPFKYYQVALADEQAIGWSGVLKASIPEATASIQAKVVAPLRVEPLKVNIAWEGEAASNIATVTGGSGRYSVETPAGVTSVVSEGSLGVAVPAPGTYDLVITDLCVRERQLVEVQIEEVLSVEISTSRAVCVGSCVPIAALVKGVSHRYLTTTRSPEWRLSGSIVVKDGTVCGLSEGSGRVRASLGGVWSPEVEILVFPPLRVSPPRSRVPPGARLQLRHVGGPPPHLAALRYHPTRGEHFVDVSPTGSVHGISLGTSKIRLVATDIVNVEMASAEAEVEVVPISGLRVRAATQTLLVGNPSPLWIEAAGLTASSLAALSPLPRVTFSVRDPTTARLYTTHIDDMLERSVAEGLSVRVVPLKPGLITIDVRVRNMGQVAETRSWDSTIEILAISDIRTSIDGLAQELAAGDRVAITPGSVIRLKTLPRSNWKAYTDGAFELTNNGEIKALAPGHGVIVAQHKDERNNIYRESVVHVEVALPHYLTVEPAGEEDEVAVRLVLRSEMGRELLSPDANVSVAEPAPVAAHVRRAQISILGNEILLAELDAAGAFMGFSASAAGVTVTDEVWVTGNDLRADRVVAIGGWGVCLEGTGWRAPPGLSLYPGSGVTLAMLNRDASAKHVLRMERSTNTYTVHQIPVQKIEFLPGEWPAAMVPLVIETAGLTSGPLLCSDDQKYAIDGIQPDVPFKCRTKPPHTAQGVADILSGQIGCSIVPAAPVTEPSEVEVCAEWDMFRTCTKVLMLPPIKVTTNTVSLADSNPIFTITGHPLALKGIRFSISPGLKIETNPKENEIDVLVKAEAVACGIGWVNVKSKLTAQDIRVEVDRQCDMTCGTLLGAVFSLLKPYLSTLASIAAVAGGLLFLQTKMQQRTNISLLKEPPQSVLPPESSPQLNRSRTWSRSPYASNGPAAPVYGDTSVLPDNSFSPNTTRMHTRFL